MSDINWQELNDKIFDYFPTIIEIFDLELRDDGGGWVGVCPIHEDADNPSAFRIFPNASWFCFSKGCAENTGMIYLLKLLLEKRYSMECNALYVLKWFVDHVLDGKNILDLPKSVIKRIKTKHVDRVFFDDINKWQEFAGTTSETYKKEFSEEIVEQYHIGECNDKRHRFYNRIVVPHISNGSIIGYTGRSKYPQCLKCKKYHALSAPCPAKNEHVSQYEKWIHVKGFRTSRYIFNSWRFVDQKPSDILLVESVGNTLRLVQSGFELSGGLYGARLSAAQADFLQRIGVKRIVWIADNDPHKAGVNGALRAADRYKQFKFRIITPYTNDIKDMTVKQVQQFLHLKGVKI